MYGKLRWVWKFILNNWCFAFNPGKVILLMEEFMHRLRLAVYPIIYDGFYTSQVVVWDFFHQQYRFSMIHFSVIATAILQPELLKNDVSDVSDCSHLRELTSQLIAVLRSLSFVLFVLHLCPRGSSHCPHRCPHWIIFLMWLGSSSRGRIWCSDFFCGWGRFGQSMD